MYSRPRAEARTCGQNREPRTAVGGTPTGQPPGRRRYIAALFSALYSFCMYQDFHVVDRWSKANLHCVYQALIVAIATRHADAVDIKFLVDGRPVWVALPHPAWVEYKKRTGQAITDTLAVEIAGHYLKVAAESGEGLGREMYSLTVEETLKHLEAIASGESAQPVASA